MNLFLTGVTGFCGSHIAQRLLREGHSVWALSRRSSSGQATDLHSARRLTIISGDLVSLASLPPGIDAVIHTAAVSPIPGTRICDLIDNIVGTQRLVTLAVGADVGRFIFFSSLSLYGEIRAAVADEQTPVVNPGPYGATKLFGEWLLQERAAAMSSIALRLPAVLGRGASRHWLATIVAQARQGREIRIFNPDAAFNNAVHVDDLGDLIEGLLHRTWSGFDAITLGANGSLPIREIAARVAQAAGASARVVVNPAPRPCFMVSSERAKAVYGYRPMNLSTMLTRYMSEL
jgi:nucleoside-diphosphate-sugar epimerase